LRVRWVLCAPLPFVLRPSSGEEPSPSVLLLVSVAFPRSDSSAPADSCEDLGRFVGLSLPSSPLPCTCPTGLPCSSRRTPTECCRWRVAARPVPSRGLPHLPPGSNQGDLEPQALPSAGGDRGPCLASKTHGRLDRLTSQARSGRGHVSHRARHASGDAPWHASAKHSILEACFFRITPFRSMLLTLQKQLPLNSRRNSLPVKRIDGSRLMCHEYATRALVELMQSGHTPSGADPVLPHAPQACKRIAVVTTVGWPARPPQRLVPVCTCRRALLRPVEATAVGA
jgi:hypothetical protein